MRAESICDKMSEYSAADFEISDAFSLKKIQIGEEAHPILILDDLLKSPEALIAHASRATRFKPVAVDENYYPGLRAPAPKEYSINLVDTLRPLVAEHFGISTQKLAAARCAYSIATMSPHDLSLAQRIPHFDTVEERQIAAIHYLCDPEHGGTAFFRHRSTGYESITRERSKPYFTTLKADLNKFGEPDGYASDANAIFDRIADIDARRNRAIVYASNLLHSGMVNAAAGLSSEPEQGRLTTTLFARFA